MESGFPEIGKVDSSVYLNLSNSRQPQRWLVDTSGSLGYYDFMIKLLGSLDKKQRYWVGVSGGPDSMAAYHFLKKMKYLVQPIFFHHGSPACDEASRFVLRTLDMVQPTPEPQDRSIPKGKSREEHWRDERYKFFKSLHSPVIVAHHLDDAVETWIWGCLHGQPQLIPYRHANVIRPFLATPKAELLRWAETYRVPWIDDHTNADTSYQRNYIRRIMMPHVLRINPGISKTIRKKLLARGVDTSQE